MVITKERAQQILDEHSRYFGSDLGRFMTGEEEFEVRRAWLAQGDGRLSFRDALAKIAHNVEPTTSGAARPPRCPPMKVS